MAVAVSHLERRLENCEFLVAVQTLQILHILALVGASNGHCDYLQSIDTLVPVRVSQLRAFQGGTSHYVRSLIFSGVLDAAVDCPGGLSEVARWGFAFGCQDMYPTKTPTKPRAGPTKRYVHSAIH